MGQGTLHALIIYLRMDKWAQLSFNDCSCELVDLF